MGSIQDKQEKWLKNLVPHPICFQCDEHFETFEHLVLECRKTLTLRRGLQIRSWQFFFNDKSPLKLKFLVATILCSWTEEQLNVSFFMRELGKSN